MLSLLVKVKQTLDRPWGFQEVETPRFQGSRHMKVVSLSALRTGCLCLPRNIPGTHFRQNPQGHTRRFRKKTELLLWRFYCSFHNILRTVPFKIVFCTGDTPFPTFLPLLEFFLGRTFCQKTQPTTSWSLTETHVLILVEETLTPSTAFGSYDPPRMLG